MFPQLKTRYYPIFQIIKGFKGGKITKDTVFSTVETKTVIVTGLNISRRIIIYIIVNAGRPLQKRAEGKDRLPSNLWGWSRDSGCCPL